MNGYAPYIFKLSQTNLDCSKKISQSRKIELVFYLFLCYNIFTAIVLQGGWPPLHRMEVMRMKDHFDFKDLMSFAMFLLALLTFIYLICQ